MRFFVVLLAVCSSIACSRSPKHALERVDISGPTVTDNAILGMTEDEVQALLEQKLQSNGHFVLPKPDEKAPAGATRVSLELTFTREAQKEGRAGTWAEVGATAILKRKLNDESRKYEVVGLGEIPENGESADARSKAMKSALSSALEQIVASADLLLAAQDKSDKDLEKDLKASDSRVKEFAIRTLAERGNPVVVDALLERLHGSDPEEIHRSIGALVEMHEKRAVPALIDLAKNRDPAFMREIVFALGTIGGDDAEAYLFTVAQGSDQPEVQAAAEEAMKELREKKEAAQKRRE